MFKKYKKISLLISLSLILLIIFYIFLFVIDIGINSKYQASKSFNTAFYQRMTGNCEAFKNKVVDIYRDKWFQQCLVESSGNDALPIRRFEIKEISTNKNEAFLLVELERDFNDGKANDYVRNYKMIKKSGTWLLNQEMTNK